MTSVLLDSGPLVLFLCGSLRPDLIGKFKTKQHTIKMFEKLIDELRLLDNHISLPNVLTEASNHLGAGEQQPIAESAAALGAYIRSLDEIYRPSSEVVEISEYMNVGLADAAIISCVSRLKKERVRVFTQDWELYNRLSNYKVDCVNIMHWATPAQNN